MKQEIKDQIRQMADEMYPEKEFPQSYFYRRQGAVSGAETVMQRLDIDDVKLEGILLGLELNTMSLSEAKQQILNAITLK